MTSTRYSTVSCNSTGLGKLLFLGNFARIQVYLMFFANSGRCPLKNYWYSDLAPSNLLAIPLNVQFPLIACTAKILWEVVYFFGELLKFLVLLAQA